MSADIETMRANAGNRLLATDTALSSQRHEEALGTRMTHKTCAEHLCCTRRRNLKAVAPAEGLLLCATRWGRAPVLVATPELCREPISYI